MRAAAACRSLAQGGRRAARIGRWAREQIVPTERMSVVRLTGVKKLASGQVRARAHVRGAGGNLWPGEWVPIPGIPVVLVEGDDGQTRDHSMVDSVPRVNATGAPRVSGWLGNVDGVDRRARGAYRITDAEVVRRLNRTSTGAPVDMLLVDVVLRPLAAGEIRKWLREGPARDLADIAN